MALSRNMNTHNSSALPVSDKSYRIFYFFVTAAVCLASPAAGKWEDSVSEEPRQRVVMCFDWMIWSR